MSVLKSLGLFFQKLITLYRECFPGLENCKFYIVLSRHLNWISEIVDFNKYTDTCYCCFILLKEITISLYSIELLNSNLCIYFVHGGRCQVKRTSTILKKKQPNSNRLCSITMQCKFSNSPMTLLLDRQKLKLRSYLLNFVSWFLLEYKSTRHPYCTQLSHLQIFR